MVEFFIYKTDGKFTNKALSRHLEELKDGKYKIEIKKADKRTLTQNAWFHAVLPQIKDALVDIGYKEVKNEDDAKAVVKALFFKKVITNGVESIEVIEGTSEQSKINFAEKADEIIRWGFEYLGIDIAPPNKQMEVWE